MDPPSVPSAFVPGNLEDLIDASRVHTYYPVRVKTPGWKIYFKVYVISGHTIQTFPFPKGYVVPGGVVGREGRGDHLPIWPMSMARSLYLEKEHDRKLDEHIDELRRNRDV